VDERREKEKNCREEFKMGEMKKKKKKKKREGEKSCQELPHSSNKRINKLFVCVCGS
jgi:hypothetical protein